MYMMFHVMVRGGCDGITGTVSLHISAENKMKHQELNLQNRSRFSGYFNAKYDVIHQQKAAMKKLRVTNANWVVPVHKEKHT